ncbi:hypothetical protein RCL1_008780 [Eukaryota sp. TZLM3-RCL]
MRGIFIHNIPWWTLETNIRNEFGEFGTITYLVSSPVDNYVYLEFQNEIELANCLSRCNSSGSGLLRRIHPGDRPESNPHTSQQFKVKSRPLQPFNPSCGFDFQIPLPNQTPHNLFDGFQQPQVPPQPSLSFLLEPSAHFPPKQHVTNTPKKPKARAQCNGKRKSPVKPIVVIQDLHNTTQIAQVLAVLSQYGLVTSPPNSLKRVNNSLFGMFKFASLPGEDPSKALESAQSAATSLDRSARLSSSSPLGIRAMLYSEARLNVSGIPVKSFNELKLKEYFLRFGNVCDVVMRGNTATVSFYDWSSFHNALNQSGHPFKVEQYTGKKGNTAKKQKVTKQKTPSAAPSENGSVSSEDDMWEDME